MDAQHNNALNRKEFLVDWKQCEASQNSWKPLSSFLTEDYFRYLSKNATNIESAAECQNQDRLCVIAFPCRVLFRSERECTYICQCICICFLQAH